MPFHRSDEDNDHRRDIRDTDWRPGDRLIPGDPISQAQLHAIAALIGTCEGVAASGHLGTELEAQLRIRIASALTAFHMPSMAELVA